MNPYRASWQRSLHQGAATLEQVDVLLECLPHATLFNTPQWCQSAAGVLLGPRALHVLTVTDGDTLAAWVPLTAGPEHIHGLMLRTLRLLGHPYNDRVALPMRGGDVALAGIVVDALLACPYRWDVLIVSELYDAVERSQLDAVLTARPALGVEWRACSNSPVLRLTETPQAAQRARSAATRTARARRKLAAAGEIRFERQLPTAEQVPQLVGVCKAIEDRSWKGTQGLGIFSSPTGERFFTAVGVCLAARGWLDVGLLYLDGKPVSYRFGFRYRNVFLDFNLAFDPAYSACAPGRILLDDMIASSRQQGLDAVDASRSSRAEPHLLADWTDERIEHHELWLFGPSLRGRLIGWARRHVRPLLQRLQTSTTG